MLLEVGVMRTLLDKSIGRMTEVRKRSRHIWQQLKLKFHTIWDTNSEDRCSNPPSIDYLSPESGFVGDCALNRDEKSAISINKDDFRLKKKAELKLKQ